MFSVLEDRTYRHLFLAQVIALLGTGLATVALGLLSYDIAGASAGEVLGTAFAIKMIAYIAIAPIAAAFAERLPRRVMLVSLDLVRALAVLALPFVKEIWQIYFLIFVLQSGSAAFTPIFQATIPIVLHDERDYTRALSLARLAYELDIIVSPIVAAALLSVVSSNSLFASTVIGFLISASLVASVALPNPRPLQPRGIYDRITRGCRIFIVTPRLRGLFALNIAVAAVGAMVLDNTVVMVQADFGMTESSVALALTAFGGGSILASIILPDLLEMSSDRSAMLSGALLLALGLLAGSWISSYGSMLALWFVLGIGYSIVQTPSSRLLRRSVRPEDKPAVYAAQFALSHACWLVAYLLAGRLGVAFGLPLTFMTLSGIAGSSLLLAALVWPADDPAVAVSGQSEERGDDDKLARPNTAPISNASHGDVWPPDH
jgi:MFS family permease